MRKSKLDVPHIKKQVIKRLATGEPQASIAKSVGLCQPQISRFANRGDIKPFIEQEQIRLAEAVPDAVDNVKELVKEMRDIPKKDIRRRELILQGFTRYPEGFRNHAHTRSVSDRYQHLQPKEPHIPCYLSPP